MIQLSLFSSLIKFIKSLFIQITVNKFRSPPSSFYIKLIIALNISVFRVSLSSADPAPRHRIGTRHQAKYRQVHSCCSTERDIFCGKMSGSAKWMVCLLVAAKLNLVLSSQKSFDERSFG